MKTLAIIGAGHLGQQIAHYAIYDKHYEKVVFFDDVVSKKEINGFEILGNTSQILTAFNNHCFNELIIGIGYKHLEFREKIFKKHFGTIPFGTLVHSSAWVDPSAIIQPGCIIYPRCEIDQYATIQSNTILNMGSSIAHNSTVGKHSFLSPRVAVAGFVTIGDGCFLGINSTIVDNITIASQSQIGAGAVVIKPIEKKGLFVGNPAKFVR
jgi:sugar O-acyltransferase (sialic acid O-acetyltransferase NeuD family)